MPQFRYASHVASRYKTDHRLVCLHTVAVPFSDRLVPHLIQKLEGGNERTRIATVAILRHLINSADNRLDDKRPLVLAGLRQLLSDSSNKVCYLFKPLFTDCVSVYKIITVLEVERISWPL